MPNGGRRIRTRLTARDRYGGTGCNNSARACRALPRPKVVGAGVHGPRDVRAALRTRWAPLRARCSRQLLLRIQRRELGETTTTQESICNCCLPWLRSVIGVAAPDAHKAELIDISVAVAVEAEDGLELDTPVAVRNGLDAGAFARARPSRVPRLSTLKALATRHSNHRFGAL